MRWFLTNPNAALAAALTAEGETIVSGPQQIDATELGWLREASKLPGRPEGMDPVTWGLLSSDEPIDDREVNDYRFRRVLDSLKFDVLVLTPLRQPTFGFARGPLARWSNRVGRRGAVVGIAQDPDTMLDAKGRQWRACAARPEHCNVYVTDHAGWAAKVARERRAALWSAGSSAAPIVRAVTHSMTQNYQAGRLGKPFV